MFAVNKGRFTDRFVGGLPQDELQTFIVRLITGFGERVQGDQISDAQLSALTSKVANFAGLTSLSFKKLSKLKSLVDAALESEDALDNTGNPSEGVVTALKFIRNANADIRVSSQDSTPLFYS